MRCAACGKHEERMLISNFLQIWQEQHEWTDFPRKGHVCKDCIQWLQSQDFKDHLYNDPLPEVTGPERKWDNVTAICIGIFDGELARPTVRKDQVWCRCCKGDHARLSL